MTTTISVRVPRRPVEGCLLRAQGLVRSSELARDEVELRWRWLRGEVVPNCAFESCEFAYDYDPVSVMQRGTALQCAACVKANAAREELTFCSARCFIDAWPRHKQKHAKYLARPRANSEGAASDDDWCGGCVPTKRPGDDDEQRWEVLCDGPAEVSPSADEVGRRLRVECYGVARDEIVARGAVVTETVLAGPSGGGAPRRWVGETSNAEERVRVASYNVLAEIYATPNMYPYCARWALDWQYRFRRLVDEIIDVDPDVLCLQEAQRDHYERDVEPALEARGYEGIFAQKAREGAAGKVDGCAMFWKRAKFRLSEHRTVSFNDLARGEATALALADRDQHAFLLRLVKDNVAQIAVLETFHAVHHRRRLCVANTHLYSNKENADTKLWQALALSREIDRLVHRHQRDLPLVIAGDFNSVPTSSVYALLATGTVDPNHADLHPPNDKRRGPFSILPDPRNINHRLNLASAYRVALGAEPSFTILTPAFQGTLDYVWYDPATLRCAAVAQIPSHHLLTTTAKGLPNAQFPSDHIMLACDLFFLV
ncbi:hypothetical protein CTAYLR_009260 [Chrysophaeum taylorii]|uniref:Endonuclease/exonuclease/phosphatase domain-containing protein n=1 Tax=Chrysophaeum taylorii TaxID=2483200 RepID=A0AAD7XF50_9STRA|nr:hypothetical protein CTAYLR_009260 [Chrysophaeum taylorii]